MFSYLFCLYCHRATTKLRIIIIIIIIIIICPHSNMCVCVKGKEKCFCCVVCVYGDVDILRVRKDVKLLMGEVGHGYIGSVIGFFIPASPQTRQ
jgi:hypothetical protein